MYRGTFRVTHYEHGEYVCEFPFCREFINWIKSNLPRHLRRWDPGVRGWRIGERYLGSVQEQAAFYGFSVCAYEDEDRDEHEAPPPPPRHDSPSADLREDFLQHLSFSALRTAYIAAVKELHPDGGAGDEEKLKKVNRLWDEIQKAEGKKNAKPKQED